MRTQRDRTGTVHGNGARRVIPVSLIAAVVLGLLAATATTPALAADSCTPYYPGGVACARYYNMRVDACDHSRNGLKVRAQYRTIQNIVYIGKWDPDGAWGACAHDWAPAKVVEFRLCEEFWGCTRWRPTT